MIKYKLERGAYAPAKAHRTDAGFDLRTPYGFGLPAHSSTVVDTGIHVAIPEGYVGFIKSKSGLYFNKGVTADGTIDCGYTGSIRVKLFNHGSSDVFFCTGDKITQLVILPILMDEMEQVDALEETERGAGGFGSTGK